jgi:hypothetical protein
MTPGGPQRARALRAHWYIIKYKYIKNQDSGLHIGRILKIYHFLYPFNMAKASNAKYDIFITTSDAKRAFVTISSNGSKVRT